MSTVPQPKSELPIDSSIEAEYSDGFVLSETELGDVSPYDSNHNVLRAILNKDPEPEHGRLARVTLFYKDKSYDIDWTKLPENARPIRFRDGSRTLYADGRDEFNGFHAVRFGYQYNDESGKNVQEVIEVK